MITSILTVSSAAAQTALTTRERAKVALNINDSSLDDWLDLKIPAVTRDVVNHMGVAAASDGTRTIGRQTLVETFRLTRDEDVIQLSKWPVQSITSIVEDDDDDEVDEDDYELNGATGHITRLNADIPVLWAAWKVTVTYIAGWLLPGEAGADLPEEIESAVWDLLKLERSAMNRDPRLKSEEIPGVWSGTYWVGGMPLPPEVAAKLGTYTDPVF